MPRDRTSCPVCRSADLFDVFHWPDVPANSALFFPTAAEAQAHPRCSLRLVGCHACGFVFNADADEELIEYSERSIETQAWSNHFQAFVTTLAADWVNRFALRGKTAIEIGCGRDPSFLRLLCTLSGGRGIGLDPSVDASVADGLVLIPERFDERFLELEADAVVCRHTLEHIVDVDVFLGTLRDWAERHPGAIHLFEVPDTTRILRETAFWDIFYEHCSYFAECSLRGAFSLHGFHVHETRLAYDDQYLLLAARFRTGELAATSEPATCGREIAEVASDFGTRVERATAAARERFAAMASEGPLVLWQAGAKAAGFLAATGLASHVTAAVDVNPAKRGLFLVGSGLPIVGVGDVGEIGPRHVVAMNEVYGDEIRVAMASAGVDAQLYFAKDLVGADRTTI